MGVGSLFKKYLFVLLVSMIPIIELRGAIPIGVIGQQLPFIPVLITAVIGNIIPVPFILWFAKPILLWCTTWPGIFGKIFSKIHEKGLKAGNKMLEKTGNGLYYALFLFVAIPLPGTGAWTGSLAATLLELKFWPSMLSITFGVICAGVIILALSSFGVMVLH